MPSRLVSFFIYLSVKELHARIILTNIWSKFIPQLLRYCHFMLFATFSNVRWQPSLNVNCKKVEISSCQNHSDIKLVEIYSVVLEVSYFSSRFAIFSTKRQLGWSIFFMSKRTLCKNHSDTNLLQIHSAVTEISFLCLS